MKFLQLVFSAIFDTDEFLYQRERRKFHEAIARGEKPKKFPVQFSNSGAVRVDTRDIVVTQEFRDQCEAVRRLRATQHTTSPKR